MKAILKIDIRSGVKRERVYGLAGDEVEIISDSAGVLIVEDSKSMRFAVTTDEVTKIEKQSNIPATPVLESVHSIKTKGSKKNPSVTQNSLF